MSSIDCCANDRSFNSANPSIARNIYTRWSSVSTIGRATNRIVQTVGLRASKFQPITASLKTTSTLTCDTLWFKLLSVRSDVTVTDIQTHRMDIFSVELDRRKSIDLNSADVIGGDVNLRHDDVITVCVHVGEPVPDWNQSLTVYTPRSVCTPTYNT